MNRATPQRGAALVELAITTPLLITCLMFGLYFTELLHAKLKLQELTRYLAWELTSYTLSDYGSGDSERAFETAQTAVHAEAMERYRALDSSGAGSLEGFALRLSALELTLENEAAPLHESAIGDIRGEGGELADRARELASRGVGESLARWHFNSKGRVKVHARVGTSSTLVPRPSVGSLPLHSEYSLIADGWSLPDGGDSVIEGNRAGNHRGGKQKSGLYTQVARMHFLGDPGFVGGQSFLGSVGSVLPLPSPSLTGTFVVSHNYGAIRGRSCQGIPGYPRGERGGRDARGGLSDLTSLLDDPKPACFDTAPLRDTQKYADSLYGKMFDARGAYFMGCQHAQADNPGGARDATPGDRSTQRQNCEDDR